MEPDGCELSYAEQLAGPDVDESSCGAPSAGDCHVEQYRHASLYAAHTADGMTAAVCAAVVCIFVVARAAVAGGTVVAEGSSPHAADDGSNDLDSVAVEWCGEPDESVS